MPGQLKDRLPNRALSGPELAAITRAELRAMMAKDPAFSANIAYAAAAFSIEIDYVLPTPVLKQTVNSRTPEGEGPDLKGTDLLRLVLEEFDSMTARHYIFGNSGAYRKAEVTMRVVAHVADPHDPGNSKSLLTGEAPLKGEAWEQKIVVGLQRSVKLDNPNIDRINHDLPIIVQRATPPAPPPSTSLPGEAPTHVIGAPGVENREFRYDATQFPAPEAPVDVDISKTAAAKLGVPVQAGE